MTSKMEVAMKQQFKLEDWNERKAMAKAKKEEFKLLNNYVEPMRSSFVESYHDLR